MVKRRTVRKKRMNGGFSLKKMFSEGKKKTKKKIKEYKRKRKQDSINKRVERTKRNTKRKGKRRSNKLSKLEKEFKKVQLMDEDEFLPKSTKVDASGNPVESELSEDEMYVGVERKNQRLERIMDDIKEEATKQRGKDVSKKGSREKKERNERRIAKRIKKSAALTHINDKVEDVHSKVNEIDKDIVFLKDKVGEITQILENMNEVDVAKAKIAQIQNIESAKEGQAKYQKDIAASREKRAQRVLGEERAGIGEDESSMSDLERITRAQDRNEERQQAKAEAALTKLSEGGVPSLGDTVIADIGEGETEFGGKTSAMKALDEVKERVSAAKKGLMGETDIRETEEPVAQFSKLDDELLPVGEGVRDSAIPPEARLQRMDVNPDAAGDVGASEGELALAEALGERETGITLPPGSELPEGAELKRQSGKASGASPSPAYLGAPGEGGEGLSSFAEDIGSYDVRDLSTTPPSDEPQDVPSSVTANTDQLIDSIIAPREGPNEAPIFGLPPGTSKLGGGSNRRKKKGKKSKKSKNRRRR